MEIEYEKLTHFLVVKITGKWTDSNSVNAIEDIKKEAEKTNSKKILMNLLGLEHPETNVIRHNSGKKIAENLSSYKIAGFSQPEKINYLAEITANNRGANLKMFESGHEASEWLIKED